MFINSTKIFLYKLSFFFFSIPLTLFIILPLSLVIILLQNFFETEDSKKILFIGGNETSNNIFEICKTLAKDKNYFIYRFIFKEHPFYKHTEVQPNNVNTTFEKILAIKLEGSLLTRLVKDCFKCLSFLFFLPKTNIFFFNWSETFLPFNLDLLLLKLMKKQVFIRHCGDEVRYRPLQDGIHTQFGINQWNNMPRGLLDLLRSLWAQWVGENFATVLSTRDHATFQLKELTIRPYVQSEIPPTTGLAFDRDWSIIHAPSNRRIKGTSIVVEAIEKLSLKRNDFSFQLIEETDNAELVKILTKTSIVLDQPGATPARLAVEGLAAGCIVVGGNCTQIHGIQDLPVLEFPNTPDKLLDLLESILDNKELYAHTGNANRQFWKKNFSEDAFKIYFDSILDGSAPTFNRIEGHENYLIKSAQTWYEKLAIKLRY